jgi:hypothetical protein
MRQLIPLADGVIYSSATYAKNPDVMDLYSATDLKLGVGGDIGALASAVTSGGIPFQQITAGMLTQAGQYIRRERSFDGVTYKPLVMEVDTKVAEDVSSAMAQIRNFEEVFITPAFEQDGEATGSNAVGGVGEQAQTFTSLMHNIIDQMLLALKVKPSVEEAIRILKKGEADSEQVVLTVSNTMGAFIERYATDNKLEEGDEVKAEFNDLLQRYHYNTRLYTTDEVDENGDKVKFWLDDEMLGEQGVQVYNQISMMIGKLKLEALPVSPVDFMLNELKKAGFPGLEITGRAMSIDYSGDVPVLSKRDPFDRTVNGRNKTIRNYNDGKNRAIILNRSGSTGISLHASERNPVTGQGKRHMIVVQAEKDINVHMQMLGRVHRTGQVIEPAYIQAVANIPAEMKPAALLLARMSSLSANTTADADSLFTDKGTVNFLNKYGDRVAAEALHANPMLNRLLGSPMTTDSKGKVDAKDLIKKVTGRLPLLPINQQEQVYAELIEAYKDLIAELDSTGKNDLEAKTFDLDARTIKTMEISPKSGESPFESAANGEKVDMKRIGKPYSSDELIALTEENAGHGEEEATQALAEFEIYRAEALSSAQTKIDEAETDAARAGAEKVLSELTFKLNADIDSFKNLNNTLKVGYPITIDLNMGKDEPAFYGVVVDKLRRGNPRNPLALSTWRVKVAVADGIRIVNLPFSKLSRYSEDGSHKIKIGPWTVDIDQAAKRFDKALTNSREERWLITGNLFTGYSTFQKDNGQIIHFTRDNGETEQGVLMPRGFNPVTALSEAPVAFENVDQMESFLEAVSPAIIKLRQPGELMIVNNNGRMIITTHKSVSKGGRFFKDDRALLKITGSFTSTGNRMVSEPLGKDQIKQVMELFLNRGNTWFADMGITEARGIINGKKLSVGKSQIRNPANIEEELRAELGGNLDTLLNSGKVRISNQAEATGKKSQKGKVQGFTKSNNTVTLIQGNIEAGNAWSVFLHELGVHTGQLLMSNKEFQGILESLEKRKNEDSATGKAIRAAYTRVPKKTKPEHVLEEVLAYMVENNSETTLVRRVIAIVKKTLLKFGISADIMNNEDLTALAVIAVKRQASQGVNQNDETINGRSEGEEAPGNKGRVSKLRREVGRMGEGGRGSSTNDSTRFSKLAKGKEPRAFTKDDLESDEFKEFFGDSKILDDDGEPLEVFFGSESFGTKDSSDYWTFGAREGKKTNSPEAGLGQYFTTDKTEAMGYTRGTGNVKGFYLRLERPLKIHSSKLPHFSGKAEAAAWAKRKKELDGHDGLVLTDRDHIVIFDKNQAKSSEVTTGEFSRDNDDTRYSVAAEPLTTEFLEETAGSITYHKNEKIDSNFLDRIFSTPEYYFKKFAAAGRVLQAALLRRDIRYTKETEILGDFVKYIQKLRKTDKKAYKEANDYLINTDQEVDGFRIESSKDDDSWTVIAPLWAVNGDKNKQTVGIFSDEAEAVKEMIEAEALAMQRVGYSMEAIKAVTMARELTNRGFDVMAEDMRKIIREAKENGQPDPFIGDGKLNEAGRYGIYEVGKKRPIALFASQREAEEKMAEAAEAISYIIVGGNGKLKNFKNQMRAKAYAKKHSGTVKGQKVFGNLTVKRRSDADMRPLTVKEALAQMGDLRGVYFPRIRESGEYVLIARKDGENPIRKHFDVPAVGDSKPTIQSLLNSVTPMGREAKRLKLKGYTVTVKKDDSPAEDVFEATNLVTSLDAILQGSLSTINKNDSDDVKAGQHINQILTMQVADIFKSRGYLSSRIKRLAGDEIWEGYEEDMGKALTQYGKNVAAGTAKRDTARAMVLAFSGRDYSWAEYKEEVDKPDYAEYEKIVEKRRISERSQKNLFRDVRSFMIDILRNDEQADRIMGTFKGLAVLKYLGFRVSSATVNMTNMVQGVPATIAGHTGESLKDSVGRVIAAATVYGKYRSGKGSVSQADRDIFEYISKKGWDEAQFNHEAASELRGKLGEKWNKFMTASMFMFGAAEKANRAMTLFAAYKAVKEKNTNMSEPLVWEKAKEISDRAHGIYGKETIPAWARGKYNILRLTYTFQKFSHNYMLNMIDLGFTKKEYKAAAYMLLSPALLAGSSASLAGPALFALASALGIGGDDPEEEFYKWAEDTFGGETFARHGIFGALAGINIKGSLQMNNPMPTNLKELAGPVGGILGDTVKGFEHLFKGELAKGAESLLPTAFGSFSKATREATEGITTGNYGSVFYGDEPLRADAADAFIRFLSFNPSRLSGIREKQWHERKVKADYQADKTAIYAKIKRLNLKGMSITPELYKEIYAYNYRVSSSGRRDLSRITGSSIRTMLKRNQKASKLERERAVN